MPPTRRTQPTAAPAAPGRAPVTQAQQPASAPRRAPVAIARSTVTQRNQQTGETVVLRDEEARSDVPELAHVPNVARVTVSGGVTINMGNYEFIRADSQVEMPCLPTEEACDAAHAFAKAKVAEYIAEDVEAAKARMASL